MTEYDFQTLMQKAINAFQPENAAGIDATIQFHVSGVESGDWNVSIRDQKLSVAPGVLPTPSLTLAADMQDILSLVSGKLDPMKAFMQGKVQVKGDIRLAMRLMSVFKRS